MPFSATISVFACYSCMGWYERIW